MKICLIGNMNNNLYVLAKLLRKKGIDAHLYLFDTDNFYLPEQEDSYLSNDYPNWIKRVKWGSPRSLLFNFTNNKKIRNDVVGFDLYVTCGFGPLFLKKAKLNNYIFRPYGSDLYLVPSSKAQINALKKESKTINSFLFLLLPTLFLSCLQRKAIKNSLVIASVPTRITKDIIKNLNLESKCVPLGIPLDLIKFSAYSLQNENSEILDGNVKNLMAKRKNYDLILFAPARHEWRKNLADPNNNKGNDLLIKGVAKAIKEKDIKILLVLAEWGTDLLLSKELVKKLAIENNIFWMPRVSREELRCYYYLADIVADQFVAGGCGTLALETLSLEKPLLTYIYDNFEKIAKRPVPPCLNTRTPEEICQAIVDFATNKEKYADIGKRGRQWVEKYHGDGLVDEYIRLFEHILSGKDVREFVPSFEKETGL